MHKDTFQATSLRKPNAANETTFLALRCENFLPIFLTQDQWWGHSKAAVPRAQRVRKRHNCARVRDLDTGPECLWTRRTLCVFILGPLHPLWRWDWGRSAPQLYLLHLSIPSSHLGFPGVSPYPQRIPSSSTIWEPQLCLAKTTTPAQRNKEHVGILVV